MSTVIVLIEDDARVRGLVAKYLEHEGMVPVVASDGRSGLAAIAEHHPALVLLDVRLPDTDGWTILRQLRRDEGDHPAVIMLTARSDEPDRLLGLDLGADDYIVKPFSLREVVARIKAVLRRTLRPETDMLRFPGLTIDRAGRVVWRHETPVSLTPKEFDLLVLLASRANRVVTREDLYDAVWGDDGQGIAHTLDAHINRLRRKLAHADGRAYLTTVKGVGYKFEVPHA